MRILDEDGFDAYVAAPGLCCVVFSASNCRPSARQLEEMDDLAPYASATRFASIDALMHEDARRKMDVRCLPTTIIFRDGEVAKTLVGYQPRVRVEAAVYANQ